MHISPARLLLGAALLALATAGATFALARPREAAAQQGGRGARFQVAALLGSPGAWVILDTESGDFEHWRADASGAMSVVRSRYASRTGSARTIRMGRDEQPATPATPPPPVTPSKREP